ncbi:MAG: bifunctional DNA-formamidopyrimidine glycosylase/DNA-(apurinic or apyrimidinic site) lyase [Nanoarchaeota archaeon]|nr:bifunctional DNA-formamidopyrimidine glycosylase/DNA-(apurinic or apyrimidinic site) lyase [Nanoarchaeota archaeon]
MPELPEVETIVQQLRQKILHKTTYQLDIVDSKVVDSRITQYLPFTITAISRRGKSIIMHLDNGRFLLTHLRMTGHFHYRAKDQKDDSYQKFLCGTFYFNDGSFLTHNSIRRFGSITIHDKISLEKILSKLGPEPLAEDFTSPDFVTLLSLFPNANIKTKLLDQHCLAGIGNIYAQEALYHAGINPERKIKDISSSKLDKLYKELRQILLLSIENQGSTVDTYSNLTGQGKFQNYLAVYHQKNCPKSHPLQNIKKGGRSTFYCPQCQK